MKIAEILSVGDELLSGNVVDTNAAYLSRALGELGFSVRHRQTCGDRREEIVRSLTLALSRADLVLVTGGLGPTYDDITRQVTAEVFGVPLLRDEETEQALQAFFHRRGIPMSENNLLQALVPQGADVLKNDWGTAPGLWLRGEVGSVILLPGVPREMKALFENRVRPVLEKESEACFFTLVLRLYGISESLLDEKLRKLTSQTGECSVATFAVPGEVELHVSSSGKDKAEAEARCRSTAEKALALVGDHCYGEGDTSLEKTLVEACREKGASIAAAEDLAGVSLSRRIAAVSGAEKVVKASVCALSDEAKKHFLGVSEKTLSAFGAHSRESALEMAKGVRRTAVADIGISITGVLDPTQATEKDPVGTVYIAVAAEEGEVCVREVMGTEKAGREHIFTLASSKAMAMTLEFLKKL